MGKARPSSRACSYIPNQEKMRSNHGLMPKHYVSFYFTDYPIAKDYQTRPQNLQPNPEKMSS